MSAELTLAEVIQMLATECGPTLRHDEVAAQAASTIRSVFAVMPRRIGPVEGDFHA